MPRSVGTMTSCAPLPVRSAVVTEPMTAPMTFVCQMVAPVAASSA